jgi:predicted site-specific integrase-resolvase
MSKETQELTTRDVAERLGAGVSTITLWCREGRFPHARSEETPRGLVWYIPESDLNGVEIKRGRPRKPEAEKKPARKRAKKDEK